MKLPKFPSPLRWWGLSLLMGLCTCAFGYRLRDVFSGVIHARSGLGPQFYTWDGSPWQFTIHVTFLTVITGLGFFIAVMTAIAGFSSLSVNRAMDEAQHAIDDADRAIAKANLANANIENVLADSARVAANADRALAEAKQVVDETDQVLRSLKQRDQDL